MKNARPVLRRTSGAAGRTAGASWRSAPTAITSSDVFGSSCTKGVTDRERRLDAFVGNAGVLGLLTPLHQLDPKTWDDVMAVNVTANWRLIRSLDPLLRLSGAGRVAFITSGAASRADLRAYWGPYAISKAALDALARTYAAETLNTSNIRVMLINPGPLRTRMRATAMPGEDPLTLRAPEELAPKVVEICSPDWTETGKLYDFPRIAFLASKLPIEASRSRLVGRASSTAYWPFWACFAAFADNYFGDAAAVLRNADYRELCTPFRLEPRASERVSWRSL